MWQLGSRVQKLWFFVWSVLPPLHRTHKSKLGYRKVNKTFSPPWLFPGLSLNRLSRVTNASISSIFQTGEITHEQKLFWESAAAKQKALRLLPAVIITAISQFNNGYYGQFLCNIIITQDTKSLKSRNRQAKSPGFIRGNVRKKFFLRLTVDSKLLTCVLYSHKS